MNLGKQSLTSPIDQILLVLILFESVELIPFADVCSKINISSVACPVSTSQGDSVTPFQFRSMILLCKRSSRA